MAERYGVGRAYTKRRRIRAVADLDGMRAVMDALAANYLTVQGRIADLERRAAAHLKRANMPLDLRAPIYGDPTWLRDNERTSWDWYAFSTLNTIRMMRKQIERGELWYAVDFALDMGGLAAEAKMIQYMASNPARAGKAKAANKKPAVEQTHAAWLAAADKLWKTPGKKKWGALAIAREIDPARAETIRKIIGPLRPR